ncbi:MAG: hypothetical protein WB791_10735 [Waddliaceae bacterium]
MSPVRNPLALDMGRFKSHVLFFLRIFVCIVFAGFLLYAYIDQNNDLTAIQQTLPALKREVDAIQLENERMQYEIDRFENPAYLLERSRQPEFHHLKYPYVRDVIVLPQGTLEKK